MANCGTPLRKFIVPSIGSIIHLFLVFDLFNIPLSSVIIPYSGWAFWSSSNKIFSVLLSADDTKSPGAFEETCKFSISPKSLIKDLDAFKHALVINLICG